MSSSVITTLGDSDKHAILDHLKRLNPDDRRMRFFNSVGDAMLENYVKNISFDTSKGYGIYIGKILVAFAHVGEITKEDNVKHAELGISIDADSRGKGMSDRLMKRVVTYCKSRKISVLFMSCLKQNRNIQAVAKKAGMRVYSDFDEATAEMDLSMDPFERITNISSELWYDRISVFDKCLRANTEFLESLMSHQNLFYFIKK